MIKKEELLKHCKHEMEEIIKKLLMEFSHMKAGRASVGLVEEIKVDYYGSRLNINQVASISIPEPRTIIISPWDKTMQQNIYKAILKTPLSLTPIIDGDIIRITLPILTQERKKELIKIVKEKAEEKRIATREIRRKFISKIKEEETAGRLSEDNSKMLQKDIQRVTDNFIEQIDKELNRKEKEILEE